MYYIRQLFFLVLVIFSGLFIIGCVSTYPVDLELVSVAVKDYKYQEELPPTSEKPEKHFKNLDSSKPPVGIRHYQSSDKSHRLMLKVEFQTKEDLARLRVNRHFVLAKQAFLCQHPKVPVLLGDPSVYWKGINLSYVLENPITRNESDRLFVYYTFFDVRYDFSGPTSFRRFDLLKKSEDICFQLKGGNNTGFGYESNVVVISKEAIMKALKKVQVL
jgi:hypothetical protein